MGGNGAPVFKDGETYNCRVESVQALEAGTGSAYLLFKLIVIEGEMVGQTIDYEAYATEGRKRRFQRELESVGFVPAEGMCWDDLPKVVAGRECAVTMKNDDFNKKNKLKPDNMRPKSAAGQPGGVLGKIAGLFGGHATGKPPAIAGKVPF